MPLREALNSFPISKVDVIDPRCSDAESLGICPPVAGVGRKRVKKDLFLNDPPVATGFQLFRFFDAEGRVISDSTGRKIFGMMPSTAESFAASMGVTVKRV